MKWAEPSSFPKFAETKALIGVILKSHWSNSLLIFTNKHIYLFKSIVLAGPIN